MTEIRMIPTDTPAWSQNGTHTNQAPINMTLVKMTPECRAAVITNRGLQARVGRTLYIKRRGVRIKDGGMRVATEASS